MRQNKITAFLLALVKNRGKIGTVIGISGLILLAAEITLQENPVVLPLVNRIMLFRISEALMYPGLLICMTTMLKDDKLKSQNV